MKCDDMTSLYDIFSSTLLLAGNESNKKENSERKVKFSLSCLQ